MQFTRVAALLSLVGACIGVMSAQPADASRTAQLPFVPKGADIPKEVPEPETFIVFDAFFDPSISNAITNGALRGRAFGISGASEFTLLDSVKMDAELKYKSYSYKPVSNFTGMDGSLTGRVNMQLNPNKVYAGLGYIKFSNNYGFPRLSGMGVGIGKLPLLDRKFSLSGSFYYYPNISGICSAQTCSGGPYSFAYSTFDYDLAGTYALRSRLFLNAGYGGDRLGAKASAPSNISHQGPYMGLGVHL